MEVIKLSFMSESVRCGGCFLDHLAGCGNVGRILLLKCGKASFLVETVAIKGEIISCRFFTESFDVIIAALHCFLQRR